MWEFVWLKAAQGNLLSHSILEPTGQAGKAEKKETRS